MTTPPLEQPSESTTPNIFERIKNKLEPFRNIIRDLPSFRRKREATDDVRAEYSKRLRTFNKFPGNMLSLPIKVSPIKLAIHGWSAHDENTVKCNDCSAYLSVKVPPPTVSDPKSTAFAVKYIQNNIRTAHDSKCKWYSKVVVNIPDEDYDFKEAVNWIKMFFKRPDVQKLDLVTEKDDGSYLIDEPMKSDLKKYLDEDEKSCLLAILGWLPDPATNVENEGLKCRFCLSRIIVKPYSLSSPFHPIKFHARYCPIRHDTNSHLVTLIVRTMTDQVSCSRNPIKLAIHGWSAHDENTVKCNDCSAYLSVKVPPPTVSDPKSTAFAVKYIQNNIRTAHDSKCKWYSKVVVNIPDEDYDFKEAVNWIKMFFKRPDVKKLDLVTEKDDGSYLIDEPMKSDLKKYLDEDEKSCLLAILGWLPDPATNVENEGLKCRFCLSRIIVKPYSLSTPFHPIKFHARYCPIRHDTNSHLVTLIVRTMTDQPNTGVAEILRKSCDLIDELPFAKRSKKDDSFTSSRSNDETITNTTQIPPVDTTGSNGEK
uniref:C3HC-type domain-containing protein n=1 Tax=Panagrolaimus sp. JU765 TaxID=591449 RepID=A0AC34QE82_9BILA